MYIQFDLPELPPRSEAFSQFYAHSLFIQSPSARYEINALSNTYVRLVDAALVEYDEGSKRLREFWSTHSSVNLRAMNRSISHFESCILDANRATNCFRRLRGDSLHDPVALALRQEKFSFASDLIADRIRGTRNEIHHLEESVLHGKIVQGQNFALRPDGPEVPHPSEGNQTVKTIDRLTIGSHEILFSELASWLAEMTDVVSRIADAMVAASQPEVTPEDS